MSSIVFQQKVDLLARFAIGSQVLIKRGTLEVELSLTGKHFQHDLFLRGVQFNSGRFGHNQTGLGLEMNKGLLDKEDGDIHLMIGADQKVVSSRKARELKVDGVF